MRWTCCLYRCSSSFMSGNTVNALLAVVVTSLNCIAMSPHV